jgi:hypothetical protein
MSELKLDYRFDAAKNRHYLNDEHFVLHCHHYATLVTQLAVDAEELVKGTSILKKSSEESFLKLLTDYFDKNGISDASDRLDSGCRMFSELGLGKIEVASAGESSGEITMNSSHVDEGWVKKWGTNDAAVNFIGSGYVAALFAAAYGKAAGSYTVDESQSIVSGAGHSVFKVQA